MICGPELARCISEFECPAWSDENNTQLFPHHEEGFATQLSFKKQVQSLIDTVTGFGNPFEDDCSELLILNTRACTDDSVIETVRSVETLGKAQYQQYKKEVITERTKSIHDSIKRIPWHCLAHLKGKLNPSLHRRLQLRGITQVFLDIYTLPINSVKETLESFSPTRIKPCLLLCQILVRSDLVRNLFCFHTLIPVISLLLLFLIAKYLMVQLWCIFVHRNCQYICRLC